MMLEGTEAAGVALGDYLKVTSYKIQVTSHKSQALGDYLKVMSAKSTRCLQPPVVLVN